MPQERQDQRGVAIVAVLWLVLLLSLICAALVAMKRSEKMAAVNEVQRISGLAIAEAGINLAVLSLVTGEATRRGWVNGMPRELIFEGIPITVAIQDEAGKIDLNTSADIWLQKLFTSVGVSTGRAEALVDAIADYRDPDDLRRASGAEIEDYRAAGRASGPKNAPFELIEELSDVLGMTTELFKQVHSALTVFSGREQPDTRFAPALVRNVAVAMDEQNHATAIPEKTMDMARFRSDLPGAVAEPAMIASQAYTISSTAQLENNFSATREVVVRLTGNPDEPVWVYAWRP